ncbi:MAG: hypothetical protein ACJ75S_07125 [Solirubrobacterales bacterium]|jgi:hypothetical protein
MKIVSTTYACETCGYESTDKDSVAKCEAQPLSKVSAFTPGDVVVGVGSSIGDFALRDGNSDPAWFLEDRSSGNRGGWVKWVVLDIILATESTVASKCFGPGWGHEEGLLLYAPSHPCHQDKGPAFGFYVPKPNTRVVGVVSQQDLDGYRSVGMRGKPSRISY